MTIYKELGQVEVEDLPQFHRTMDSALSRVTSNELLSVFTMAALTDDQPILGAVASQLVARVSQGEVNLSAILREVDSNNIENDDVRQFGLVLAHRMIHKLDSSEIRETYEWARQCTIHEGSYSVATRIMTIKVASEMLSSISDRFDAGDSLVTDFGEYLLDKALNQAEESSIRRASIKAIAEIGYEKAIPELMSLCQEKDISDSPEVLRAICVTFGHFRVKESIPILADILQSMTDQGVLASASVALADIGGSDALKVLVQQTNHIEKRGADPNVCFGKLASLIIETLLSRDESLITYAVQASQYLSGDSRKQAKNLLLGLLHDDRDNVELVASVLSALEQQVDATEAADIVSFVPRNPVYDNQWSSLDAYAKSIDVKCQPHPDFSAALLQTGGQEYGDAGYRELGFPVVASLGHAGLFAGVDSDDQERILEVQCSPITDCSDGVLKQNLWADMTENPDFWGRFTLSNTTLSFDDRRNIMETAWDIQAYDPGYPPFILIAPWSINFWPDDLNPYGDPGIVITPDEIKDIRCDGLVEYCYEYNGKNVWGKNGANYNISITANLDDHNDFYEGDLGGDPNTELAPVVQCGRAGGTSTYMTEDASSHVELPEYHFSYSADNNVITAQVKATDESGIHQIFCKPENYPNWIEGKILSQHPLSDHYRQEFVFILPTTPGFHDVQVYAIDNGGNGGPEFAVIFQVYVCDGAPAVVQPVSPTDGATNVDQDICLDWQDISGATDYRIQYGLEDNMDVPWDDISLSGTELASYICPTEGFQGNKRYWWRIRVWTDCGESGWSPYYWFTTNCSAVARPQPYVPEEHQCLPAYVAIAPVPGATGYLYQSDIYGPKWYDNDHWYDTLFSIGGLGPIDMRIKSYNECGESDIATITYFGYAQPNRALLLSPNSGANDVDLPVTLSWQDGSLLNDGAITEYYELQVSTDSLFAESESETLTETDFAVGGLSNGQRYFWRVRACNTCYCGNWSVPSVFTTRCVTPESSPVNIYASSEFCDYIRLTWEWPFDDVSGFNVYRVGEVDPIAVLGGSAVGYTDSISGTQEYFVRAVNQCGEGPASDTVQGVAISAPTSAQPTIMPLVNKFDINWGAVENAKMYELSVDQPAPLGDTIISATENNITYSLPLDTNGLSQSGIYVVGLTCINDCGSSGTLVDSVELFHIGGQVVDLAQDDTLRSVWVYIGPGEDKALSIADVDSTLTNDSGFYRFVVSSGVYSIWRDTVNGNVYTVTVADSPIEGMNFDVVTDVQEIESPELPNLYSLSQNYPNPFNPSTQIEFEIPKAGFVEIQIFNVLGKQLRTLVSERLSAGRKVVTWDGTDNGGHPVASGVYFYRISTDGYAEAKKMLLLK